MSECKFFLLKKFSRKRELDNILGNVINPSATCQCDECDEYDHYEQSLEFKDFTFHYHDRNITLFSDFNLKIGKGEKLGVVGSSGDGKSTLLSLILGLPLKHCVTYTVILDFFLITSMVQSKNFPCYLQNYLYYLLMERMVFQSDLCMQYFLITFLT